MEEDEKFSGWASAKTLFKVGPIRKDPDCAPASKSRTTFLARTGPSTRNEARPYF
jgi:hypothetical protein